MFIIGFAGQSSTRRARLSSNVRRHNRKPPLLPALFSRTGMTMKTRILTITLVALLSGCATAILGDKTIEAELKKFQSRGNLVSLYVCREDSMNGAGIGTEAFVNGRSIGSLKANTFAHTELPPGPTSIFLRRNGVMQNSGDSGTLNLETKEGEVVIIWAGPAGFMGPLTVDEFKTTSEGQDCVRKATYATLRTQTK